MGGLSSFKENLESNINSLEVKKETFRNIITGDVYRLLESENISKTELAKQLHVSKPAVTKLLSGDRNFTIDKIVEISDVLGYYPKIMFMKNTTSYLAMFINKMRFSENNIKRVTINRIEGSVVVEEEIERMMEFTSMAMIKRTMENYVK